MTKDEGDARVGEDSVISTAGRNPRSTPREQEKHPMYGQPPVAAQSTPREQEELVAEYWLLMSAY